MHLHPETHTHTGSERFAESEADVDLTCSASAAPLQSYAPYNIRAFILHVMRATKLADCLA